MMRSPAEVQQYRSSSGLMCGSRRWVSQRGGGSWSGGGGWRQRPAFDPLAGEVPVPASVSARNTLQTCTAPCRCTMQLQSAPVPPALAGLLSGRHTTPNDTCNDTTAATARVSMHWSLGARVAAACRLRMAGAGGLEGQPAASGGAIWVTERQRSAGRHPLHHPHRQRGAAPAFAAAARPGCVWQPLQAFLQRAGRLQRPRQAAPAFRHLCNSHDTTSGVARLLLAQPVSLHPLTAPAAAGRRAAGGRGRAQHLAAPQHPPPRPQPPLPAPWRAQ